MMNYLKQLLTKLRAWKEAKVNKQPLSRENAYVLSSIRKNNGQYQDIVNVFQEELLKEIKENAKYGEMYLLKEYPPYMSTTDKEIIESNLIELGYSVCYRDQDVILISWKYSQIDFNESRN